MEHAIDLVANEISELKKDIAKKEKELLNICEHNIQNKEEKNELSELQSEFEKIQVEITVNKNKEPETLTNHSVVWLAAAREQLETLIEQLCTAKKTVSKEKKEIQKKIQRLNSLFELDKKVVESLENKLKELEASLVHTRKEKKRKQYEKLQKMQDYIDSLSREMYEFISEHFPPPSKETVKQKTRGLNTYHSYDVKKLKPMVAIVEELVQQWLIDQDNPYVSVDERMWPPYVELLLRYGMAVRHPENNHLIKLEDFRSVF